MKFIKYSFLLSIFLLFSCSEPVSQSTYNPIYHTVTFDSRGGTGVNSQEVLEGNTIRRPNNPTYDNHSFIGWFISEDDDSIQWNFDTDRVYQDTTLFAHWTEIGQEVEESPTTSLIYEEVDGGYSVIDVGDEERIIIPETHEGRNVVSIGESAFARKNITYVSIPDSVVSIERNAFHNCSSLVEVNIKESSQLQSIGRNAFSGNSSLESFFVPSSVLEIGDSAFNNCGSLETITVAQGNMYFSSEGRNLIDKQTMTLIRGSNTSTVPEGVRAIAQAAFRRSKITTINIPSTVEEIGNYAFDDCDNMLSFTVSSDSSKFESDDGILFSKGFDTLEIVPVNLTGDITLPEGLVTIPSASFYQRATNMTSLSLPSTIENIGSAAFRGIKLEEISYSGTVNEFNSLLESGSISSNAFGYYVDDIALQRIVCTDGEITF